MAGEPLCGTHQTSHPIAIQLERSLLSLRSPKLSKVDRCIEGSLQGRESSDPREIELPQRPPRDPPGRGHRPFGRLRKEGRTASCNLSDPTTSFHAAAAAQPRQASLGAFNARFNTSDLCPGIRVRYIPINVYGTKRRGRWLT